MQGPHIIHDANSSAPYVMRSSGEPDGTPEVLQCCLKFQSWSTKSAESWGQRVPRLRLPEAAQVRSSQAEPTVTSLGTSNSSRKKEKASFFYPVAQGLGAWSPRPWWRVEGLKLTPALQCDQYIYQLLNKVLQSTRPQHLSAHVARPSTALEPPTLPNLAHIAQKHHDPPSAFGPCPTYFDFGRPVSWRNGAPITLMMLVSGQHHQHRWGSASPSPGL